MGRFLFTGFPALSLRVEGLEFNVSDLLRQNIGVGATFAVDSSDVLPLGDDTLRHISGSVRLMRTNFGILARARLRARVELECDRCLERFESDVDIDFNEEYLPVIDVSTGRPVQSERTDETFFISPNHVVDLTEAVRQHGLLAIPMHRICREDCRSLCTTCGANLNSVECDCSPASESPLSALAALLSDPNPDV